mmetsp:Transcript_60169/g.175834  ORF Transcript_60169/g.175834 Transcript_60169/m.175834 type:complete len:233 (+) Transcript_60169:306-1004(+)
MRIRGSQGQLAISPRDRHRCLCRNPHPKTHPTYLKCELLHTLELLGVYNCFERHPTHTHTHAQWTAGRQPQSIRQLRRSLLQPWPQVGSAGGGARARAPWRAALRLLCSASAEPGPPPACAAGGTSLQRTAAGNGPASAVLHLLLLLRLRVGSSAASPGAPPAGSSDLGDGGWSLHWWGCWEGGSREWRRRRRWERRGRRLRARRRRRARRGRARSPVLPRPMPTGRARCRS